MSRTRGSEARAVARTASSDARDSHSRKSTRSSGTSSSTGTPSWYRGRKNSNGSRACFGAYAISNRKSELGATRILNRFPPLSSPQPRRAAATAEPRATSALTIRLPISPSTFCSERGICAHGGSSYSSGDHASVGHDAERYGAERASKQSVASTGESLRSVAATVAVDPTWTSPNRSARSTTRTSGTIASTLTGRRTVFPPRTWITRCDLCFPALGFAYSTSTSKSPPAGTRPRRGSIVTRVAATTETSSSRASCASSTANTASCAPVLRRVTTRRAGSPAGTNPNCSSFSANPSAGAPHSPTHRSARGVASPATYISSVLSFLFSSRRASEGVHVTATCAAERPGTSPSLGCTSNAHPEGTSQANRAGSPLGLEIFIVSVTENDASSFFSNANRFVSQSRSSAAGTTSATTSNENSVPGLSLTVYATVSLNGVRCSSPFSASSTIAKCAVSPAGTTRVSVKAPPRRLTTPLSSEGSIGANSETEETQVVAVMASETTEVPRRSSRRADTACAVPLVKAKYFTCVDPPATDPKSSRDGPAESFAISAGISTRAHSRLCAAVAGSGACCVRGPPPEVEVSASTACCGRFRGRRYENGIFGFARPGALRRASDGAPPCVASAAFAAFAGSIHKGSSARGSAGPRSVECALEPPNAPKPAPPPLGFLRSYWVRNPRLVGSAGSSAAESAARIRAVRELRMYAAYPSRCAALRAASSSVNASLAFTSLASRAYRAAVSGSTSDPRRAVEAVEVPLRPTRARVSARSRRRVSFCAATSTGLTYLRAFSKSAGVAVSPPGIAREIPPLIANFASRHEPRHISDVSKTVTFSPSPAEASARPSARTASASACAPKALGSYAMATFTVWPGSTRP